MLFELQVCFSQAERDEMINGKCESCALDKHNRPNVNRRNPQSYKISKVLLIMYSSQCVYLFSLALEIVEIRSESD